MWVIAAFEVVQHDSTELLLIIIRILSFCLLWEMFSFEIEREDIQFDFRKAWEALVQTDRSISLMEVYHVLFICGLVFAGGDLHADHHSSDSPMNILYDALVRGAVVAVTVNWGIHMQIGSGDFLFWNIFLQWQYLKTVVENC